MISAEQNSARLSNDPEDEKSIEFESFEGFIKSKTEDKIIVQKESV